MVILDFIKTTTPVPVPNVPTLIPQPIPSSAFCLEDDGAALAHHPSIPTLAIGGPGVEPDQQGPLFF